MKVYFLKTPFILIAVPLIFQACNKNSSSSSVPPAKPSSQNVGNINFELRTTDMQGNTKSDFSPGENFIPTLTISNSGSQLDTLCRCLLPDSNPNLLGVYSSTSEKYGDSAIYLGKPWNGRGPNYFIFYYTSIPAHSKYIYAIPWSADTTKYYVFGELTLNSSPQPPLPAGQYFTQFTFKYNNTQINLKYNFSVQ